MSARLIPLTHDSTFSLAETCAPAAWATGRWPNHDWIDAAYHWVGWEEERVVTRTVRHHGADTLAIDGAADPARDAAWAAATLGLGAEPPAFEDQIVDRLRQSLPGLRPSAAGSLFDGVVSSIVGQSISVASAAVTEARLAALFHPGIELVGRRFWPAPRPADLARADPLLVRSSGVTMRRADALVALGQAALAGALPSDDEARADPAAARLALRRLPLVGPWTAESALLWGLGAPDAYPTGDVALLRAARLAYARPDLDLRSLDRLAEQWLPARGWAARYLWTALLGSAPL